MDVVKKGGTKCDTGIKVSLRRTQTVMALQSKDTLKHIKQITYMDRSMQTNKLTVNKTK